MLRETLIMGAILFFCPTLVMAFGGEMRWAYMITVGVMCFYCGMLMVRLEAAMKQVSALMMALKEAERLIEVYKREESGRNRGSHV